MAEKLWTYPVGIGRAASELSIIGLAPMSRAMELVLGLIGPDEVATSDS